MLHSKPQWITFTGIDTSTDIRKVHELSEQYPLEWGILLGNPANGPRYPSLNEVQTLVTKFSVPLAFHFCGSFARNFKQFPEFALIGRRQINLPVYEPLDEYPGCILQHRKGTFPLEQDNGIQWLHDESGGRGQVPQQRPPNPGFLVGYAGGISATNVKDVCNELTGEYWIDMESSIRTNDRLDLQKCEDICKLIFN